MPLYVNRKCNRCGQWDFFILNSRGGRYICKECQQKQKELEVEALNKAVKSDE